MRTDSKSFPKKNTFYCNHNRLCVPLAFNTKLWTVMVISLHTFPIWLLLCVLYVHSSIRGPFYIFAFYKICQSFRLSHKSWLCRFSFLSLPILKLYHTFNKICVLLKLITEDLISLEIAEKFACVCSRINLLIT